MLSRRASYGDPEPEGYFDAVAWPRYEAARAAAVLSSTTVVTITSDADGAAAVAAVLQCLEGKAECDAGPPPAKRAQLTNPYLRHDGFIHLPPWWDRAEHNCKGAWAGLTLKAALQAAHPLSDAGFALALAADHVLLNGQPVRVLCLGVGIIPFFIISFGYR